MKHGVLLSLSDCLRGMFVVLIGHWVTHRSDLGSCCGGEFFLGVARHHRSPGVSMVVKLSTAFLLLELKLLVVTDQFECRGLIHRSLFIHLAKESAVIPLL